MVQHAQGYYQSAAQPPAFRMLGIQRLTVAACVVHLAIFQWRRSLQQPLIQALLAFSRGGPEPSATPQVDLSFGDQVTQSKLVT